MGPRSTTVPRCSTIAWSVELADYREVVADQDAGDARFVADVDEQVQHLRLDRHVQRGDRFVEDQHPRLGRKGTCDGDPLALAAGQCAGQGAGLAFVQADQIDEFGDAGAAAVGGPAAVQPEHLIDGGLGVLARVQAG